MTSANVHDVTMVAQLLTREEGTVCGDSGYLGAEKRVGAVKRNRQVRKIGYKMNCGPSQSRKSSVRSRAQIRWEHEKSSIRAKVEHVFAVIKRLFHYQKT